MRRINEKTIIYIAILSLSITIFIFAFSVYINSKSGNDRDISFFSNNTIICDFNYEAPTIDNVIKFLQNKKIDNIAFLDSISDNKYIEFNQDFKSSFNEDITEINNSGDVYVSKYYRNNCYIENGIEKINISGNSYDVAGYIIDDKFVEMTGCYINMNNENAIRNNCYQFLLVDMGDAAETDDIEAMVNCLSEEYSDCSVYVSDGNKSGTINLLNAYFIWIILCGVILCLNCFDFTTMWVKSYRNELNVRSLVGARKKDNHIFILTKYFELLVIATLVGIINSFLIKHIVDREYFAHLRRLLISGYCMKAVVLSVLTVLILSGVVLEITWNKIHNRSINS